MKKVSDNSDLLRASARDSIDTVLFLFYPMNGYWKISGHKHGKLSF